MISIGAIVDPAVVSASLWGAVAASSLLLGGWLACRCTIGRRTLGLLMGFGAGTLLSAVSLELVFESLQRSRGSGYPAIGFFAGAFTFFFGDKLIEIFDLRHRHRIQGRRSEPGASSSSLVVPMILGIVLDGVPESMVIGLGRLEHTGVSVAMLVAVLLSNLPEAIAGTVGMKESGWSRTAIMLLWLLIALACAGASAAGFSLFSHASKQWLTLIQCFAGGAILVMLANSMIPESYEHGGKLAGIFTVIGFAISVSIIGFDATRFGS